MSRILALDFGEKRIGVAISDRMNVVAQGLETIEEKDIDSKLAKIKSLIKEYDVSKVIVGMPLNMNGTKGDKAIDAEGFAALLQKEMSISVEMVDERLTTAEGENVLLEADVSRKKRKRAIDKIAAQLILQTYLDLHE